VTLEELAFKYGTDKRGSQNDYVRAYEELFVQYRNAPMKLLEIGVYNCGSHNMWVDYFSKGMIYGIDINDAQFDKYNRDRLRLDKIDQGNQTELLRYAAHNGLWDIIIDDGGHYWSQQKTSFKVLWDFVKPGGFYIVEDTHTSYWNKFRKGGNGETLMDYMLKLTNSLSDGPHYKRYYANPKRRELAGEKLTQFQKEIEYMRYEMGLCIIKKRANV
jgi:hypothetical protein